MTGEQFLPLLKTWAEEDRAHGGVIFVDEKTFSPSDIGGLVGFNRIGDRNWELGLDE